jgi:hypothetical protein
LKEWVVAPNPLWGARPETVVKELLLAADMKPTLGIA